MATRLHLKTISLFVWPFLISSAVITLCSRWSHLDASLCLVFIISVFVVGERKKKKRKGKLPRQSSAATVQTRREERFTLWVTRFFSPLQHKQTASWRSAPTLHLPLVRTHSTTHGRTVHSAGPWKRDFPVPHQKRPLGSEFQLTNSAELQRPQRDEPIWPPMYQHWGKALSATLSGVCGPTVKYNYRTVCYYQLVSANNANGIYTFYRPHAVPH